MRILFICKRNETYGFTTYTRKSSGLYNSTSFIVKALKKRGVHAEIIEVIDNNCIDRHVKAFKPDKVVIEALWVVPDKFDVLKRLHPTVEWYVHMHSGMSFLALEGIAMEWLPKYAARGVGIIANSPETYDAFRCILTREQVKLLPNVYWAKMYPRKHFKTRYHRTINVGCFGAIRPMKNHLLQAMAAIKYANDNGLELKFHINGTRVEGGGQPVLKNLIALFEANKPHKLVRHHWMEHDEFLELLHKHIDIGLQVSLTETFNVVSADCVSAGVPIVVSKEVKWANGHSQAADDSIRSIVGRMDEALGEYWLNDANLENLHEYAHEAADRWYKFVHPHAHEGLLKKLSAWLHSYFRTIDEG